MNIRTTAGYIITDSIHVGETEFVLGVHSTAANQFVTWSCKDGKDYYWGHYYSDLLSATKDLLERATQELEYCMGRAEKKNAPQKGAGGALSMTKLLQRRANCFAVFSDSVGRWCLCKKWNACMDLW